MVRELLHIVDSTKYPLGAFMFVQRGLDYTVRQIHGEDASETNEAQSRHVTGRQLCLGLREFAVKQYGLMARTVLKHWQINNCEDFGHIVFAMVDAGLMHRSESDSIRDFADVFDFDAAFSHELSLN